MDRIEEGVTRQLFERCLIKLEAFWKEFAGSGA